MINTIITKIFGDPSEKRVKGYIRDLEDIKIIETRLRSELTSLDLVQTKTREFMARFEGLDYRQDEDYKKIRSILDEIKYEAFATHRIACELINGQTFVPSMNYVEQLKKLSQKGRNLLENRDSE